MFRPGDDINQYIRDNYLDMTDEQMAAYEATYEIHEIAAHDLSKSEENEVAFFRWLLDHHDPMGELE